MPATPLTISALSTHIMALFERDALLRDVWVIGEVSNWKRAASGHCYFSLKDSGATIGAVMWRTAATAQRWLPRDGDQIIAHGQVSIYPDRGQYQIYINQMEPAGKGQLYAAFEALKAELAEAGLFDAARKRPIPAMPQRIAVITSAEGAALRDILRVLSSRWPLVDMLLFSSLVQGGDAAAQLVAALANANRYSDWCEPIDCIVIARGGGSIEDLWCFNDATLAHAIAASHCPVVTGVGHETDFTIADFVADLRAPTPSAAAALCTPDRDDQRTQLDALVEVLEQDAVARIEEEWERLDQRRLRLRQRHPQRRLDRARQQLDDRMRRLQFVMQQRLRRVSDHTATAALRLDALNPQAVLQRGYSIVRGERGQVVDGPDAAHFLELLTIRAAEGEYVARKME